MKSPSQFAVLWLATDAWEVDVHTHTQKPVSCEEIVWSHKGEVLEGFFEWRVLLYVCMCQARWWGGLVVLCE